MTSRTTHTTTINCIIIDDDPFVQDLLNDKLNQYFPEIKVLAICNNGRDGINKIASLKPQLIFLDVEMGDMTGFEMLSKLPEITFKTIFITSYKHYAIKAIRFNALDYLLKPFDLEELRNAVRRFKANGPDHVRRALQNERSKHVSDQTLVLQTQTGELLLKLKDILFIEGERNYSHIHLVNDKKELVSKTLKSLEEILEDKGFFRCHKSYLVNHLHIITAKNSFVNLTGNREIPVSRRKMSACKEWVSATKTI